MKTGIYTITNTINGKIYVGCAINIENRWKVHKNNLKYDKHHCGHLQKAYSKYGKEAFKFEILEECEERFLYSQEHYWCNLLNVHNVNYGYNNKPTNPYKQGRHSEETKKKIGRKGKKIPEAQIRKSVESKRMNAQKRGYYFTEELKRKMSESRKGKKLKPNVCVAAREKCKIPVLQYSKTGEFIKEWEAMVDAERFYNQKTSGKISSCCNGKRMSAFGYIWRKKGDGFDKFPYRKRGNILGSINKKGIKRT